MRGLLAKARSALVGVVCLALVVWSVTPSFTHAPMVFDTIKEHLEMIADHGHSHGFEEDLHWAMHGHSHDVADHDHNQAFLLAGVEFGPVGAFSDSWRRPPSKHALSLRSRIERPPRV